MKKHGGEKKLVFGCIAIGNLWSFSFILEQSNNFCRDDSPNLEVKKLLLHYSWALYGLARSPFNQYLNCEGSVGLSV